MQGLESNAVRLTIEDAENAYLEANFETAIDIYQKLIELQQDNAFLHSKVGQVFAKSQNWQKAIEHYQKAIDLNIDSPFWIYKILGDALKEEKKFDEAIASYEKAINIDASNPEVYDSLGQVQSLKGDFIKAIACYQKALELNIKEPYWTFVNLGSALKKEHRLEESDSVYQKALELKKPESSVIDNKKDVDNDWFDLHNQGDELFKQEKWEDALAFYQQAIKLNPDYFWSHYNLGRALSELGRWNEAIADYQKALYLNASNPFWIYRNLGDVLREIGEYDRAIENYQQAINIQPDQPEVYHSLGQAQSLTGDYRGAIASYQKAIELGIKNPFWTYQNLGDALSIEGKLEEAQAAYEQAQKSKENISQNSDTALGNSSANISTDNNWFTIHNQGDECFKREEWEQAIAFYQQAIELNPNYSWSYCNLGRALYELNRWEKAIFAYKQGIKIYLEDASLYRYLGKAQEKIGDFDGAIKSYQKAIDLEAEQPEWVYLVLVQLLIKKEKWESASTLLHKVLEFYPKCSEAYKWLGFCQEQFEDYLKEIESYRKAIELERQPEWVYTTLMELLAQREELEEAISIGTLAIKEYPESVSIKQRLSQFKQKLMITPDALEKRRSVRRSFNESLNCFDSHHSHKECSINEKCLDESINNFLERRDFHGDLITTVDAPGIGLMNIDSQELKEENYLLISELKKVQEEVRFYFLSNKK